MARVQSTDVDDLVCLPIETTGAGADVIVVLLCLGMYCRRPVGMPANKTRQKTCKTQEVNRWSADLQTVVRSCGRATHETI